MNPVIIALPLAAVATSAKAQTPERHSTMEITRKADQKTVAGLPQYFTGKVTITGQFQREEPSRS